MPLSQDQIALVQRMKESGAGRSEIKAALQQTGKTETATQLPSVAPQPFTQAKNPSLTQAVFPRATATGEQTGEGLPLGRKIAGGFADIVSLPGRAGVALEKRKNLPTSFSQFKEETAKTKGGKGIGGGIESIVRSPSTALAAAATPFTGGGSLGLVSKGLIEGAAGAVGTQSERFAEKGDVSLGAALGETALGGAIPGAGKAITGLAKGGRKVLGRTLQETTGVSEEALSKFGLGLGKGAKELEEAAGGQFKIAEGLLNKLDNIDEALPNKAEIISILDSSPDISTLNVIESLRSAKTAKAAGSAKGANESIDGFIEDIIREHGELTTATDFRALRQQLDREIGDQFGKESSAYITALKNARNTAKNDLLENTPPEFAQAMAEYTEKLGVAERIKKELGSNATTRENRAESFVNSIFGANKTVRRQKLQDFQDLFGGNFLEDSKTARLAAELGPEGTPGLIPRQFTGRSGIGPTLGFATGGPVGAAIGAASSSPRIAAGALGGLDIIGQQASKLGQKAAPMGEALRRALQRVGSETIRNRE